MTASISYAPVSQGIHLNVGGAPSDFIHTMEKALRGLPCTLNKDDIPKLEVLADLWDQSSCNPYQHLIDMIEETGPIKVWATY